jgi:hypothetical protein
MGCLLRKDLIAWANEQIGTMEDPIGSNRTRYGALLDSVNFFSGNKNGVAWCSTFCEAGVFESCYDDTKPDYDNNDRKWDALYFTYEPQNTSINYGCACRYSAQYFRDNGAWHTKDDFEEGDFVFFGDEGNEYHQGIVTERMENRQGFYSVEGNHNNGVFKVWHDIDENISGFGVPMFDDEPSEKDDSDVKPEPTPEPEPIPEPDTDDEPYTMWFKVHTNGGILRLRSAPNTSSAYLIGIPNGTELESDEVVDGEEINGDTRWAHTTYKGYTGFVSCAWLD